MKRKNTIFLRIIIFLGILTNLQLNAQIVYISSFGDASIYELDLETCLYSQIAGPTFPNGTPYDITYHPNGKFYYLRVDGRLYEYNLQNEIITFISQIPFSQNFNSLVTDGNGLFYATGSDGDLWTYNLTDSISTLLGGIESSTCPVPIQPSGDLTFYKGDLYVAGICNGVDVIVKVNIDEPEDSEIIIESQLSNSIWGIVSFAEYCDCQNVYAITGGDSDIYQINFDNQNLTLVCQLDFPVSGGATSFEYWGSFPISIQSTETTDAGCNTNNGSFIINAMGGVGQLSYSIDGTNFQTNDEFTDLAAGSYTITIKDENDCPIIDSVEIEEGGLQIIDVSSTNDICGNGNGSITINTNGGMGQLEYSINGIDFQSDNIFNNLLAGNYLVVVQDGNNCSDSENITVEATEAPQIVDVESSNETCGNADGAIIIISIGGTGQLDYSIDGITFQADNTFNNLSANIYTLIVQDGNNCSDTTIVEVEAIGSPEITDIVFTDDICGSGNGSVTITAEGGSGQLNYSINGMDYQLSNFFDNLSDGTYTVSVQDDNDCSDSEIINIQGTGGPVIISPLSIPITCNNSFGSIEFEGEGGTPPYEFSIDGSNYQSAGFFDGLSEGFYTLYIQDSLFCLDSFTIEIIEEEPAIISSVDVDHTTCGEDNGAITIIVAGGNNIEYSIDGINFQSTNYFENLVSDSYTIVIEDSNECQDSQMITINPSELPLVQLVEAIPTSCGESNGSIIIEATGVNLEFSINGIDFQQDNVFSNLASGNYIISIIDENDCISTNSVEIASSPKLSIKSIENIPTICGESNGSFIIEVEGGTGIIQVALNGGAFQSSFSFESLISGDYDIQIVDEAECLIDTSVVIIQEDCSIYIPNAFSPNNDGFNDLFKIYPHPDFRGEFKLFKVFDRWGACVFEAQDFTPASTGWDGTHKGKKLGIGVYVYFVEYISENGNPNILEGDITIIK